MSKAPIHVREDVAQFRMTESDFLTNTTDPKEMKKIIEKQGKELVAQLKANEALQRNFESLSDFCKAEKGRSQQLSLELESVNKENENLRQKIKQLSLEKREVIVMEKEKAVEVPKEISTSLQKVLQAKNAEMERLEDALRKVKIEREKFHKDANITKDKLNVKDKKIKEQEKEIQQFKEQLTKLNIKLQEKEKLIEELNSNISSFKEKLEQSIQTLKMKESLISVRINIIQ